MFDPRRWPILFLLAVLLCAEPLVARPLPASARPQVRTAPAADWSAGAPAGASRDTVVLLGGPGRLDGRFQDEFDLPAWHGWTSVDHTADVDTFWSISTFNAEALGGHGPGNHAMWCGTTFPGGDAGYGNGWHQHLGWSWTVPDTAAITVQVLARLNHDTEPGFDDVSLQVWRGSAWETVVAWTGWRVDRAVDETVVVSPADLGGPTGDEIRLRFSFASDETWSDEDGLYPTDGACQLDDIRVYVDGAEATFDDFEPESPLTWWPRFFDSAGDFAHLASGLQDLDPCLDNGSPQVVFVDDGEVVPGTGGSPCLTWCYGPGGFVVNHTGGLAGGGVVLDNGVVSPPLAWPAGVDDLLLEFDVYVHETLGPTSPGIVYAWRVRSTADPDSSALGQAPWRMRNEVFAGGPAYRRHREPCGDLLVEAPSWIQVELAVIDVGTAWSLPGDDGTPAPYFDNVAIKAMPAAGPRVVVDDLLLAQDTFPPGGILDLHDLSRNACRFDMARNISPREHQRIDPGDSLVAEVHLAGAGSALVDVPRLVARGRANPLFNPVRLIAPGPDGTYTVTGQADSCRNAAGAVLPSRWAFDLPDSGLIFPGDVVHFFLEAQAVFAGNPVLVTWPADTSGFADFSAQTVWPTIATMRALPTVFSDASGDQPSILFWRDYPLREGALDPWDEALAALDLEAGLDYDVFRTRSPGDGAGNGLGARAVARQIGGYSVLLYDCGDAVRHTLGGGDWATDPSPDQALLLEWFGSPGHHGFLAGDNLASDLAGGGATGSLLLGSVLGVDVLGPDAAPFLDGQRSPAIAVLSGSGVFVSLDLWSVRGACPELRTFDLVTAAGTTTTLAEFTTVDGSGGVYPYAAATRRISVSPSRDVIYQPYSLVAVDEAVPGEDPPGGVAAHILLLGDVLAVIGDMTATAAPVTDRLSLSARPNPANPRATIAYELPAAGRVDLAIYDLRGRLVRTLVKAERPAGPSTAVWDGCDGAGRPCASGVYVHVLRTDAGTRRGKLTLVR
ncbi:MAG TPA: FlgD immunoglobulin-like domain containing protein [Candidatus Krumholzibacteria bacterium]|nr:FlgD immunoglobulin-like domain containing protein [Candidatus Krumholzibacteria bacterium]HPD70943.1 FlgD immunoglobulin-like domain containing protein [Candidatus Krumholzibacteria bacterium]HRY39357.1 FlgD immunoglobulin-like domain containing protein [Candidatus Krumholzibacteria bacterium]